MRSLFLSLALVALTGVTAGVIAQPVASEAPPVRYDRDLLSADFHAGRREAVLSELPSNAVAVVLNNPTRTRDGDVDYEFRVSSDLYYLTGTQEAGSALLLVPTGVMVDGESVRAILFVPPRSAYAEEWEDRRFGPSGARQTLGIFAVSNDRFAEIVEPLLADSAGRLLHTRYPRGVPAGSDMDRQIRLLRSHAEPLDAGGSEPVESLVRGMLDTSSQAQFESRMSRNARYVKRYAFDELLDGVSLDIYTAFAGSADYEEWARWKAEHIDGKYADDTTLLSILSRLRTTKQPEELVLLQKAIDITTEAQREAIRSIEPGLHEYEVEAVIEFVFKRNGAEYPAFPTIVASGENSVILHYGSNRRQMESDDMVVMDIGAEYHGYSADVTRTVPVDGRFSPEQRAIYEIVLQAQEAAIAAAQPGAPYLATHMAAEEVIATGLAELGLASTPAAVGRFFPHGTSHYLGLQTHDVGDYAPLRAGTVITIEPGIYIRPDPEIDPKYWNIGVRIEDDVLITADGPRNLSAAAPRTVEDIESLMAESGLGNRTEGRVRSPGDLETDHPSTGADPDGSL